VWIRDLGMSNSGHAATERFEEMMPYLTDPDQQLAHLQATVKERQHWVMVTDCAEGHGSLVGLALVLLARGVAGTGGVIEYFDPDLARKGIMSFLTVAKKHIRRRRLGRLLAKARMVVPPAVAKQDIILLSRDCPRLQMVFQRLIHGFVGDALDPVRN
jgi:hypothetical protein